MSDESLRGPNRYLPPDKSHTQLIIDRQSGESLGTRFWAPFDTPDDLIDTNYWFLLFSPDTLLPVQAAVITDEAGQRRLIWAEDIPQQHLLTHEEESRVLVSVTSGVVEQDAGEGETVPLRWIRAYANGEKEDQGASLVAGAFTRILVESQVDQGTIYTAATTYKADGSDVHILVDEML